MSKSSLHQVMKWMKRPLFLFGLATASFAACATIIMPVPLNELVLASDVVAIIQITEGSVIRDGETECGAKYGAQVIETLKGSAPRQPIEFGRRGGIEIGTRYLVFLAKSPMRYDPLLSTNGAAIQEEREYENKCATKWPRLNLIHSGNSAFRIAWYREKWKSSRAVFIRPDIIEIPLAGYGGAAGKHAYPTYDGSVYIPLDEIAVALRSQILATAPKP